MIHLVKFVGLAPSMNSTKSREVIYGGRNHRGAKMRAEYAREPPQKAIREATGPHPNCVDPVGSLMAGRCQSGNIKKEVLNLWRPRDI